MSKSMSEYIPKHLAEEKHIGEMQKQFKILQVETKRGVRPTLVMPLSETDKAVVYIPINIISRVDYHRLATVAFNAKRDGVDVLTAMRSTTLDNGKNALVTMEPLIRTQTKEQPKPAQSEPVVQTEDGEPKPARKKPGPKPGSTRKKPGPKPKVQTEEE